MNILPKKSWHVRTKKNIERVRRDEEQAEEERQKEEKRKALAESEARTEILRRNAVVFEQNQLNAVSVASTSHINFFADVDRTATSFNKEAEEEKRLEKEKHEKAIGLLTYLGQSSTEALDAKPWYVKAPEKKKTKIEPVSSSESKKLNEFNIKGKRAQDPLLQMSKHVELTEKYHHSKTEAQSMNSKHAQSRVATIMPSSGPKGPKSITELRAERLRREQEERRKAEQLLARVRGETPKSDIKEIVDERQMEYNSRFNPDFVRKRKSYHDDTFE